MIRFIQLFLVLNIIAANSFSQNPEIYKQPLDSIVNDLEELLLKNSDSALILSNDVISRAQKENNKYYEAKIRRIQIAALWSLGHYDEALDSIANTQKLMKTWMQGLSGKEREKMEMMSISISNEEGRLYGRKGKHREAVKIYKDNITRLKTLKQTHKIKQTTAALMANVAISYKIMGANLDSVIEMYERSLTIFKELNDPYYISNLNLNLGIAVKSKGDYQRALELYLEGYNLAKENDLHVQGRFLLALPSIYISLKDYDSAISYGKKGLAYAKEQNNLPLQAHVMIALSAGYMDKEYFDSVVYYSEKSLAISKQLSDALSQADAYQMLAKVNVLQKNYEKANTYVDLGFKVLEGHEDRFLELQFLIWKSKCMLELNNLKDSKLSIEKALKMVESTGNNIHKKMVYNIAHEAFITLDKPEQAYNYLLKYTMYQDSVHSKEKTLEIARIEYENKLESTIAIKDAEMAQQDAEIKKQKYQAYLLISGLLLLIVLTGALMQKLKVARIENELIEKQKKLDMSLLISDNKMRHTFNQQLANKLSEYIKLDEAKLKAELKSYLLDVKKQLGIEDRLDHLSENLGAIHSEFDDRLTEKFPDLTISEREICHLIRLNMSIKEIAQHRNTSAGAVKTARHRIKSKLQIKEGDNLDDFIRNNI